MATVLNNKHREEILAKIINETFKSRVEALTKERILLADRAYQTFSDPEFVKVAALYPKDWFCRTEVITLRMEPKPESPSVSREIEIESIKIRVAGEHWRPEAFRMSASRPAKEVDFNSWQRELSIKVDEGHEFIDDLRLFNVSVRSYKAERVEAERVTKGLLASVRTVEKLIEVAPELEKFIPASVRAPKPTLPAVQGDTVLAVLAKAGLKLGA